jgi:hypothetical protein
MYESAGLEEHNSIVFLQMYESAGLEWIPQNFTGSQLKSHEKNLAILDILNRSRGQITSSFFLKKISNMELLKITIALV